MCATANEYSSETSCSSSSDKSRAPIPLRRNFGGTATCVTTATGVSGLTTSCPPTHGANGRAAAYPRELRSSSATAKDASRPADPIWIDVKRPIAARSAEASTVHGKQAR